MIKYTCGAGTPEEAETNCNYFIRGECTASFCEYRRKKQTNADLIRSMSDEELAVLLAHETYRMAKPLFDVCGYGITEEFIFSQRLEWLKQPAE